MIRTATSLLLPGLLPAARPAEAPAQVTISGHVREEAAGSVSREVHVMKRSGQSIGMLAGLLACLASTPVQAYKVTLHPAAKVYDADARILHQKLGLADAGLIVESFEGEKLIDGLTVTLARPVETASPHVWDGSRFGYIEEGAEFRISLPDVRLFGIGIGDNDTGSELVSINGGPPIALQSLPNHVIHGQARAYYVLIEAAPGEESIRSVMFSNSTTTTCDHLVLKQSGPDANRPLHLVVDLADGSRVVGTPADKSVKLRFFGVDMEIPYAAIASIELNPGSRSAIVALWNGDRLSADILTNRWRIAASFGEQSIPLELVRKIAVQTRR